MKLRHAFLRWLLGGATIGTLAPRRPCAERAPFLVEPTQPHPGGAHICAEENPGHLDHGIAHRCRNCDLEWWQQ